MQLSFSVVVKLPMQPRIWLAGFLLGIALTVAGCGGDDHPRHHDHEAMGTPPAPHPVMHGTQSYFNGKIVVEATLGEGQHAGAGDKNAPESDGENGGNGGRGHGHHGHHGGGGEEGDAGGGGYLGGGGMQESHLPPVTLRLHITNTGDIPIEVTFNGCDSALGNFVVMPEKLTIPAGQSAEPDPMRSLLGVPADEIPIELSLAAAGKSEKKTVTLRLDQPTATMNEATVPPPGPPPLAP